MPFRGNEDHLHAHQSEIKHHPRDVNALARQRAEHRTRPPTDAYRVNYDEINWKSRRPQV